MFPLPARDRHICAGIGKGERDATADTRSAAGDERATAFQQARAER
jgi:hypothetical protein